MSQTKAQLISDLVQALNFTGTSSAPANGMYLSAANTISLSTNSDGPKLTIKSDGKIGINTTNPTGSLTIAAGTFQSTTPTSTGDDIVISGDVSLGLQFLTLDANTCNNNIYFGDTADPDVGMIRYAHASNSMLFQTNTSTALTLDSSQNATFAGTINTTGTVTTGRANIQKGLRTSPTMFVGANDGGSGMNNNSSKHVNICCPQYLSDTQTGGFRLLSGYAGDGTNYCYLGGSDDNITATATHPKNATQIRVFTSATATGNGVERIRVDSSGRVSIQGAATRAHLEVRSSGGTNTMLTAVFGANEGGTTGALSNDTDKGCRIGIQHYDTDALPFAWISAASGASANSINMGGGTSLMNAATAVGIYTASNTTTATGTKRFMVESDGTVHKYLDGSTIQASFGGSGQVNGITAVPSMAATPFVVGRDTGSTRSAHFGGHLKFDDGYGIDFGATGGPASGTGGSEILNDYEQGTFSPGWFDDGGNFVTSYSTQYGQYTKIGNVVYFCFGLRIGTFSRTPNADQICRVGNLPYASRTVGDDEEVGFTLYARLWGSGTPPKHACVRQATDSNHVDFYMEESQAGNDHILRGEDFDSSATCRVIVSGFYYTS